MVGVDNEIVGHSEGATRRWESQEHKNARTGLGFIPAEMLADILRLDGVVRHKIEDVFMTNRSQPVRVENEKKFSACEGMPHNQLRILLRRIPQRELEKILQSKEVKRKVRYVWMNLQREELEALEPTQGETGKFDQLRQQLKSELKDFERQIKTKLKDTTKTLMVALEDCAAPPSSNPSVVIPSRGKPDQLSAVAQESRLSNGNASNILTDKARKNVNGKRPAEELDEVPRASRTRTINRAPR